MSKLHYRFEDQELGTAPFLTSYCPTGSWTTGVLIFPGGSYNHIGGDCQGDVLPGWFTFRGMAVFVLNYRVAPFTHPIPQQDARWALEHIRESYVCASHIGVLGFSAGGHLAACLGDQPDFAVLAYPVITMGGVNGEMEAHVHQRSRESLWGKQKPLELDVSSSTPPTFLFHMTGDLKVPVENSILYYQALRKAGVAAEMHLYHGSGHGRDVSCWSVWLSALEQWMIRLGFYQPSTSAILMRGAEWG